MARHRKPSPQPRDQGVDEWLEDSRDQDTPIYNELLDHRASLKERHGPDGAPEASV